MAKIEKPNSFVVYMHKNKKTGKSYIGYTADYERRCKDHQYANSGCRLFNRSIKKHGWDAFEHKVIVETKDVEMAVYLENIFIIGLNTMSPNGYNLRASGECRIMSDETKRRMSLAKKGKAGPRLGWVPSENTRNIWSAQRTGRIPYNKGIPMPIDAIEKMKQTKIEKGVNKPNSGSFYKGFVPWNKGIKGIESPKKGKEYGRMITINGVTFNYISEACLYFGKSKRTILRWLSGKNECAISHLSSKSNTIGELTCA